MKQKKIGWKWLLIPLGIIAIPVIFAIYSLYVEPAVKVTTDLSDYRVVMGNYDNETPQKFIDSFFPHAIEAHFSEPKYYYRGQTIDTYACETHLDFFITDPDKFAAHYQSLYAFGDPQPAYFDDEYELWLVDNYMHIEELYEDSYHIGDAKLGIILCSRQQQRFIYSAIAVHDGYEATTDDMGHFFRQFNIDPLEFCGQLKLRQYP